MLYTETVCDDLCDIYMMQHVLFHALQDARLIWRAHCGMRVQASSRTAMLCLLLMLHLYTFLQWHLLPRQEHPHDVR